MPVDVNVRPTMDRVRETVFSWLTPYIVGASCLDAFAGSGVFGFEALSRSAANATFVDVREKVVERMRQTAAHLGAEETTILRAEFPWEFYNSRQFDIVFLDPPFKKNLIEPSAHFLQTHHFLKKKALIYIETEAALKNLELPTNWRQLKYKEAGKVSYRLYATTA